MADNTVETTPKKTGSLGKTAILLAALIVGSSTFTAVSAEIDDGFFFVKAEDQKDADYSAIAGMNGNASAQIPGIDLGALTTLSYSCGPKNVELKFSLADVGVMASNTALLIQGRQDRATGTSQGYYFVANQRTGELGLPDIARLKPSALTVFGKDIASPIHDIYYLSANDCGIASNSSNPHDGELLSYQRSSAQVAEITYRASDSSYLKKTASSNGDREIVKLDSLKDQSPLRPSKSDSEPSMVKATQDGSVTTQIDLASAVDGYDRILIVERSDGSGSVNYHRIGYANSNQEADRRNGPLSVSWNSRGETIAMSYRDRDGFIIRVEDGVADVWDTRGSVEDYNRITGQSWDGKVHRSSEYDLSLYRLLQ